MSTFNWKAAIGEFILAKQKLAALDTVGIFEYKLPRAAATEKELAKVEMQLGFRLDPAYRTFLSCAAGWPAFYQDFDLFGPAELLDENDESRAAELLSYLAQDRAVEPEKVYAVAASRSNIDVVVMDRQSDEHVGRVRWFAGALIEEFRSFEDYFLSMLRLTINSAHVFPELVDRIKRSGQS